MQRRGQSQRALGSLGTGTACLQHQVANIVMVSRAHIVKLLKGPTRRGAGWSSRVRTYNGVLPAEVTANPASAKQPILPIPFLRCIDWAECSRICTCRLIFSRRDPRPHPKCVTLLCIRPRMAAAGPSGVAGSCSSEGCSAPLSPPE